MKSTVGQPQTITVREYRKGNQKRTIQRNWQHRRGQTKQKTQLNM
jgi:hypothetical protein